MLATERRDARRAWAIEGGAHDRLIRTLRIALPAAIGVLIAFLALAPLTVGRDISFMLSKDRVDVAPERMRVTRAVYRGRDGKEQPFQLTAASAVQTNSHDPLVHLQTLDARIRLTDGPAVIRGNSGRYDMDSQRIAIDGPVKLDSAGGYHIGTQNVLVDMNSRDIVSRGAVTGTMPLGNFSADKLRANMETKVVELVGRARLHIVQARSRGAR